MIISRREACRTSGGSEGRTGEETYRLKHELVSTQMKLEAMRAELEKYKALETLEHSRGKEAEKRSRPGSKAGKRRVHLQMKEADGNEIL